MSCPAVSRPAVSRAAVTVPQWQKLELDVNIDSQRARLVL